MGGAASKIESLKQDLRGKHFMVTGSNTGIGYRNARELAKMGATVTMVCRSEARGKAALERLRAEALEKPVKEGVSLLEGLEDVDVRLELVDLGSLQSVVEGAKRIRAAGKKIDVLINNAGVSFMERKETVDGFEMNIGVNHFGPHLFTRLLAPLIVDGGRIVFVSSLGHHGLPGMGPVTIDWDDMNFTKPDSFDLNQGYGRSKLANILDAKGFKNLLSDRRITTYSLHPGTANTEITRNLTDDSLVSRMTRLTAPVHGLLLLSPLQGSLTTLKCAIDPALADPELSGKYWSGLKETKPSALALDPSNVSRYWAMTEEVLESKLGKKVDQLIP